MPWGKNWCWEGLLGRESLFTWPHNWSSSKPKSVSSHYQECCICHNLEGVPGHDVSREAREIVSNSSWGRKAAKQNSDKEQVSVTQPAPVEAVVFLTGDFLIRRETSTQLLIHLVGSENKGLTRFYFRDLLNRNLLPSKLHLTGEFLPCVSSSSFI